MKIRLVGTEFIHEDSWTDGQTDMTELIVAFLRTRVIKNDSFDSVTNPLSS